MDVESAELVKHGLNAFLAVSVAFANELATIAERVGADAAEVERGLKTERRIGPRAYLRPGAAFAGGTLARDVDYLTQIGEREHVPTHLLRAVRASNDEHRRWARRTLESLVGADGGLSGHVIGVWGLVYKHGTDTLRRSSSVELCRELTGAGAVVRAHDSAVRALPDDLCRQLHALPDAAGRGGGCIGRRRRDRLARLPRGRPGRARGGDADTDRRRRERLSLGHARRPPRCALRPGREPDGVTEVLAGRAAIVTGGSHGLGLEIARAYLAAGARVLVCARDAAALDRARGELVSVASDPGSVATAEADVSQPGAVERLVDDALERFSRIDVLVNNAGIYGPKGLVEEVAWDEWEQAVRVNLFGSVLCCRAVLPHFRANGYGKIIQLSGGGATSPLPRLSAYAASKAAIVRFAETLAEELEGTGIDVNAIAPGALNTRLLEQVLEAGPERVGGVLLRARARAAGERRHPARPRGEPRRLPRIRRQRRDHGQADQRAVGPVGGAGRPRGRPPRVGRLHTAPHRSGRSRSGVGLVVPPSRALSAAEPQTRGRIVSPMIRLTLTAGIRRGK